MGTEKPVKAEKVKFKGAAEIARNSTGGYVPAYEDIVEAPQRIVGASGALQKRGKTTFGFTLPKPLLYCQFDANYEHALSKARKQYGKDSIRHISYSADPRGALRANNASIFEQFTRDFDYGVDNFRSILVDTSSELMDIRKMAEFGRTTQIQQIYYGSIYSDFRWLVKRGLDSDCNVWFIHRLKDEWKAGESTGGYVIEGWKGVLFDAQVYVEHGRDAAGEFTSTIIECAQAAELMGMVLAGADDENNFGTLAQRVFPDSEPESWE